MMSYDPSWQGPIQSTTANQAMVSWNEDWGGAPQVDEDQYWQSHAMDHDWHQDYQGSYTNMLIQKPQSTSGGMLTSGGTKPSKENHGMECCTGADVCMDMARRAMDWLLSNDEPSNTSLAPTSTSSTSVVSAMAAQTSSQWRLLDSGASVNQFKDPKYFKQDPNASLINSKTASGEIMANNSSGTLMLKDPSGVTLDLTKSKSYGINNLSVDLLSVTSIVDNGGKVHFDLFKDGDKCKIWNAQGQPIPVTMHQDLPWVQMEFVPEQECLAYVAATLPTVEGAVRLCLLQPSLLLLVLRCSPWRSGMMYLVIATSRCLL